MRLGLISNHHQDSQIRTAVKHSNRTVITCHRDMSVYPQDTDMFLAWCCKCKLHIYTVYLIQNSQAVKKDCGPEKGYGEKRCEIQGGGQEMAVMVG